MRRFFIDIRLSAIREQIGPNLLQRQGPDRFALAVSAPLWTAGRHTPGHALVLRSHIFSEDVLQLASACIPFVDSACEATPT